MGVKENLGGIILGVIRVVKEWKYVKRTGYYKPSYDPILGVRGVVGTEEYILRNLPNRLQGPLTTQTTPASSVVTTTPILPVIAVMGARTAAAIAGTSAMTPAVTF